MSAVAEKYKKMEQAIALLMESFDLYAPSETREGQGTGDSMAAFMIDLQGELSNAFDTRKLPPKAKEMLFAVLSHECRGQVSKRVYDDAVPVEKRYDKAEFLLPEAEKVITAVEKLDKALGDTTLAWQNDLAPAHKEMQQALEAYKIIKEYAQ